VSDLFPGFKSRRIATSGAQINLVIGGHGPPLLLLHGYPQTHAMWNKVAPHLAGHFTVVCSDLRGYGDSSKPTSAPDHAPYSKRTMARDQVEAMQALGYSRFLLAGHDRGGRVSHRLARDHAERVERLAVLDISPTAAMYAQTDMAFATAYYHWFFLIQPYDLPERLIGADPTYFLRRKLGGLASKLEHFDPRAYAEYERCFGDPATIHASCEDYRASATIDLEHDAADAATKLECPVLALWGDKGVVHRLFDPLADWSAVARDVRGRALDCGHYLAEEAPEATAAELLAFFRGAQRPYEDAR
jgi:haloacetate dehalogenase